MTEPNAKPLLADIEMQTFTAICHKLHVALRGEDNMMVIAALGQTLAETIIETATDQTKIGTTRTAEEVAKHLVKAVRDGWDLRKRSAN